MSNEESHEAIEALDLDDDAYADRIAGMAAQAAQEAVAPLAEQIQTREWQELVLEHPELADEETGKSIVARAHQVGAGLGLAPEQIETPAFVRHVLELQSAGQQQGEQQQPAVDPWDVATALDEGAQTGRRALGW
jgi:hypothetical protein